MDNLIIERDVVLIGKNKEGNNTFDFPVTRLGNIENGAEVKETPETNDYFPIIDVSDNRKMKKTSISGILAPLNTHIVDNSRHVTPEERNSWNGKASGNHKHDDCYYTEGEIDGKLADKADKGHKHLASEISGLPSSLPANGGNADTVDGKHASEFAGSDHNHDERYYTENETDAKLSEKSDKGHKHSASDISGLPSSLPANGGNADTVDGKHASEFAGSNHNHDDRYYTESKTDAKLAEKADKNHTHSAATTSASGFMSPEDKKKLDTGMMLKSVQEVTLGSSYIYPTFTIPSGAQYFICSIRVGRTGVYSVSGLRNREGYYYWHTGLLPAAESVNVRFDDMPMGFCNIDSTCSQTKGDSLGFNVESGKIRISYEPTSADNSGNIKMKQTSYEQYPTTFQMIFF